MVSEPVFERVYIRPAERRDAICKVIRASRQRLLFSIFRCNDFRIMDEIGAAAERGVRVEALLTRRARGWRSKLKDLEQYLRSMGVQVHCYPRNGIKYHAKYLVADSTAVVCSCNLTLKCMERSCDAVLVSRDPALVEGLEALFTADCVDATPALPSRLITAPENARREIGGILSRARHSIRLVDHRVTDERMLTLLAYKEAEGVSVHRYGRGALPSLVSHGKLLLVDDSVAVMGSIGLSPASLDRRRELSVVLESPETIQGIAEVFEPASETLYASA